MPHVIPVLDIKRGNIVQAVRGDRARYAPIQSVLTRQTKPAPVLRDLLRFHPFPTVYLADLDAIMGKPSQHGLIVELCRRHAGTEFWVDAGPPLSNDASLPQNYRPVVGTEFASDWTHMPERTILSLDFDQSELRGGEVLWQRPDDWPERVIVMCLHRVGSQDGPDLPLMRRIQDMHPRGTLFAAGGARHARDLEQLMKAGWGALIASMLHRGGISSGEITQLEGVARNAASLDIRI